MISLSAVATAVVILIVAGVIFGLLWWALGRLAPPEPFRKVGEVILILGAVIVCIGVLLSLVGVQIFKP